jgi:hypothetical protein
MEILERRPTSLQGLNDLACRVLVKIQICAADTRCGVRRRILECNSNGEQRGDVPGWVLVVLMTTGLVTAIWTIAAPRLTAILRNSLDSMNGIR